MDRRTFLSHLAAIPTISMLARNGVFSLDVGEEVSAGAPRLGASMWIYLWDLVDEGYESVLSRLKDQGLTSVSLACAYHAGRFLLPHNPKRNVIFLEDGTVYFNPRLALYGHVKPRVNSLVREGHDVKELKKHADRMGLETRAWVVCCHNTPLGMKYPEIACRDVFGDRLYHNLCPSNSDVQAYIRGLIQDIASYGVSTIELEALQFQGYAHGYHHEREGLTLTTTARFLLGLCFCDSCLQRASNAQVDLHAVQTFTKKTLEEYFTGPPSAAERYPTIDTLPSDIFGPFLTWRKAVVVSFVEYLMEAVRGTRCKVRPMTSLDPIAQQMVGMDPAGVADVTGGLLALGYVRDGDTLRPLLKQLQSQLRGKEVTIGFQVGLPESGGRTEFLDRVTTARELGITDFNFYNYGLIPLKNLTWINEAMTQKAK
jgi:hypothetical protein